MKPVRSQDMQRRTPGSVEDTSIRAADRKGKIRIYANLGINEGYPEMGPPHRCFVMCMR